MVRVMEEKPESPRPRPVFADAPYQFMLVPFMDNHQISCIQDAVEVERFKVVPYAFDP
jgi:hypothetical protein